MSHLRDSRVSARAWCGGDGDRTEDPDVASCCECLREAASYGARCAMRCAAVEALSSTDEELAQERDHALAQVAKIQKTLNDVGWFWCTGCDNIIRTEDAGMLVPVRLCRGCAP